MPTKKIINNPFLPIFILFTACLLRTGILRDAEKKTDKGWYENFFLVTDDGGEAAKEVRKWRREIEKEKDFIKRLAQKYFPIPEDSEFEFKFVGRDTTKGYLFIRYFTPLPDPKGTIAGWQVLFLFKEKEKTLEKILVSEVPLEE